MLITYVYRHLAFGTGVILEIPNMYNRDVHTGFEPGNLFSDLHNARCMLTVEKLDRFSVSEQCRYSIELHDAVH